MKKTQNSEPNRKPSGQSSITIFLMLVFILVSGINAHSQNIVTGTASKIMERTTFPLTGSDWALWLDTKAQREKDELYLPYQVNDTN
ncbi:hypothetical protein [Flavobacterium sp.]|uniref:hypothetical protein n=1 Tax=Flavobacterium sp. TaxID=239 RepID=UPI0037BE52B1